MLDDHCTTTTAHNNLKDIVNGLASHETGIRNLLKDNHRHRSYLLWVRSKSEKKVFSKKEIRTKDQRSVAKLVERLLLIPKVRSSNPFISKKNYTVHVLLLTVKMTRTMKKRPDKNRSYDIGGDKD